MMLQLSPSDRTYASLHSFFERLIPFQDRPNDVKGWSENDWDNYRFITYELFLCTIAACIRARQYETAAQLIEADYLVERNLRGGHYEQTNVNSLNIHAASFVERAKRLKTNDAFFGELIHERSQSGPISFQELLQADLLMIVRPCFPPRGLAHGWYPHCLPLAQFRSR